MRRNFKKSFLLAFSICVIFWPNKGISGGPLLVDTNGVPITWGDSPTISYSLESGDCGPLDNDMVETEIENYLTLWQDVTLADLSIMPIEGDLFDIDIDNYQTYLYDGSDASLASTEDSINPLVFDNTGEITAQFTGEANMPFVLGFAGALAIDGDTEFSEGQMVLNCRCLENHPLFDGCDVDGETLTFPVEILYSTAVHEFGHFLGLDHSQANSSSYNNDDEDDDVDLPIMFPVAFSENVPIALTLDDKTSLANLYPDASFTSEKCFLTGSLLDSDGSALRCIDVRAETEDPADTVSVISGALAPNEDANDDGDTEDTDECLEDCGGFTLALDPEKTYTLRAYAVDASFTGGSSLSPCINAPISDFETEELGTISGSDCVAGEAKNIGTFQTNYVGDGSSGNSDDGDNDSDSDGGGSFTGGDAENPVNYGCSLIKTKSDFFPIWYFFISFILFPARMKISKHVDLPF